MATAKAETVKTYALSSAQRGALAKAIAGGTDTRGNTLSFLNAVRDTVANVTALRGKPLPKADADDVAMEAARIFGERGYDDKSIKVKKSQARSIALCAPVLRAVDFAKVPGLTDGLARVLKFCTALKRNSFNVAKASLEFKRGTTASRKRGAAASVAMHVKAILGGKGRIAALSEPAKKALRAWASKYGVNVKTKAESDEE